MLISKQESVGWKDWNDSKAFIEYWNELDDIYENIEEYNTNKKYKILNIFDKIISDMLSNEKLNPIVTESFIRGKKTKHFFCFYHTILFSCTEKY